MEDIIFFNYSVLLNDTKVIGFNNLEEAREFVNINSSKFDLVIKDERTNQIIK